MEKEVGWPIARDLHVGNPQKAFLDRDIKTDQGGNGPDCKNDLDHVKIEPPTGGRMVTPQAQGNEPADNQYCHKRVYLGQSQAQQKPVIWKYRL